MQQFYIKDGELLLPAKGFQGGAGIRRAATLEGSVSGIVYSDIRKFKRHHGRCYGHVTKRKLEELRDLTKQRQDLSMDEISNWNELQGRFFYNHKQDRVYICCQYIENGQNFIGMLSTKTLTIRTRHLKTPRNINTFKGKLEKTYILLTIPQTVAILDKAINARK